MKKLVIFLVTALSFNVWGANIQISAKKQTVDTRKSDAQKLSRGTTQLEEKVQQYVFTITSRDRSLESSLRVQWAVAGEEMSGRLKELTRGEKLVAIPIGQPVEVETEPFSMVTREWSNEHGRGELREDVHGYGVRILDSHDQVIAEKYHPSDMKNLIEKTLAEEKAREEKLAPLKKRGSPRLTSENRSQRRMLKDAVKR